LPAYRPLADLRPGIDYSHYSVLPAWKQPVIVRPGVGCYSIEPSALWIWKKPQSMKSLWRSERLGTG